MSTVPNIKLNTGALMPAIGLGGWAGSTPEIRAEAEKWFLTAFNAGYRHIDTGLNYGTERSTGEAIRKSGVPREEIFVATKLPAQNVLRIEESINESLTNAGLDYFDLYLLHWPQALVEAADGSIAKNEDGTFKTSDTPALRDTWRALEKVLASGRVKAIGVSNFSQKTLDILLEHAEVTPAVNQIELHPYLQQQALVDYCKEKNIAVSAFSPTGYSNVRTNPLIIELAKKYNASEVQVILAWHIARGTAAVPASSNPERQKENINLPTLAPEDVKRINALDRGERLSNTADPATGQIYGWTYEQLGW